MAWIKIIQFLSYSSLSSVCYLSSSSSSALFSSLSSSSLSRASSLASLSGHHTHCPVTRHSCRCQLISHTMVMMAPSTSTNSTRINHTLQGPGHHHPSSLQAILSSILARRSNTGVWEPYQGKMLIDNSRIISCFYITILDMHRSSIWNLASIY